MIRSRASDAPVVRENAADRGSAPPTTRAAEPIHGYRRAESRPAGAGLSRRPRVKPVYANRGALEEAERLDVARCLEVVVREALVLGRKHRYLPGFPRREGVFYVLLEGDLVAVLRRVPARLDDRRSAWLVTGVRRPEIRLERLRSPRHALRAVDGRPPAAARESTGASETRTSVRSGPGAVPDAADAEIAAQTLARRRS
jgi:hypothetical protein